MKANLNECNIGKFRYQKRLPKFLPCGNKYTTYYEGWKIMTWFKNFSVRSKLLVSFMLVLIIFVGVSVFDLMELRAINKSYTEAIDLTEVRFSHIFEIQDHFSRAQMIIREIYYPGNTVDQLNAYYNEMDNELNSVRDELLSLHEVAAAGVQKKIEDIQPMLEGYRNDTLNIIDHLRSAGEVDLDSAVYRDALKWAQNESDRVTGENTGALQSGINEIPTMALSTLNSLGEANSAKSNRAMLISIVILAVMALIIFAIALYISGLISKPLILLSTFMKKAGSTGNITLSPADVKKISGFAQFKDEIGQAMSGSAAFIKQVTTIAKELEVIASGDLSSDINLLSDEDEMGKSMKQVVDNLNSMFGDINSSALQVSIGSTQVADGAQSLAQGSTEQAASIEELSSAIAEIAVKTKGNAAKADKTSKLSETIKENAEKGSRQMGEMIAAVGDINEASKSISKIIKTIDDIAFQTNILALNAAVEAARAGQHGKGFAVVAEEVRSLASKSAEASKETGKMIQNSMDKAEQGFRIAGETAASLNEIVSGISESNQLVAEIAAASEEQSLGIDQIYSGIDQVAQVVQMNSATAEESAATSEEMNAQSKMLQQFIAQFNLKYDGATYRNLPLPEKGFNPGNI